MVLVVLAAWAVQVAQSVRVVLVVLAVRVVLVVLFEEVGLVGKLMTQRLESRPKLYSGELRPQRNLDGLGGHSIVCWPCYCAVKLTDLFPF